MSTREEYLEEVVRQLEHDEQEIKDHIATYEQLFENAFPLLQRTVEALETFSENAKTFSFAENVVAVHAPADIRTWWQEQGEPLLIDVKVFRDGISQ